MLVMSRRQGDAILIGPDIEIVIAHIGRSRVKVGIRAPRELPVLAREIAVVREENMTAAQASPAGITSLAEKFRAASSSSRAPGR